MSPLTTTEQQSDSPSIEKAIWMQLGMDDLEAAMSDADTFIVSDTTKGTGTTKNACVVCSSASTGLLSCCG